MLFFYKGPNGKSYSPVTMRSLTQLLNLVVVM